MKGLGGVQGKHLGPAEPAQRMAPVARAEGMGGIEEQRNARRVAERAKSVDVAGAAPDMGGHDRIGALGQPRGRIRRVQRHVGADLAEDRGEAAQRQQVRGRDEGVGGQQHLAPDAQALHHQVESGGGIAGQHAVRHVEEGRQAAFKLLHQRAVVGEPAPLPDRVHHRVEGGAVGRRRAVDVARRVEHRRRAEQRQILRPRQGLAVKRGGRAVGHSSARVKMRISLTRFRGALNPGRDRRRRQKPRRARGRRPPWAWW